MLVVDIVERIKVKVSLMMHNHPRVLVYLRCSNRRNFSLRFSSN